MWKNAPHKLLKTLTIALAVIAIIFYTLIVIDLSRGGSMPITTVCVTGAGVRCSSPIMNTNGQLSLNITSIIGFTLPNVSIGCSAEHNSSAVIFVSLDNLTNQTMNNELVTNQTIKIKNLQCYGLDGRPFNDKGSGEPIGTQFNGYLWVRYGASPNKGTFGSTIVAVKVT